MHLSVVGTGAIGTAFAEAFLKAGHQVTVYNRSVDKTRSLAASGAKVAASAREAVAAADLSLVALTDGAALRSLVNDLDAIPGARILNVSTTRATEVEETGRILAEKGARLSEVSVNVGPDQIRDGQGMYLLGAPDEDAADWTQLLTAIGGEVHRAGKLGDASRAELPLLLTYLFGLTASAYIAAVVARDKTPEDILATYVYPALPAAQYAVPLMIGRQFADASASVDAFRGLAENAATDFAARGLPTQALDAITALFAAASAKGFGGKDGTAVVEALSAD